VYFYKAPEAEKSTMHLSLIPNKCTWSNHLKLWWRVIYCRH